MRTLPKNISAHPDGYLVRVKRKGICYQAFVAKNFEQEQTELTEKHKSPTPFPLCPPVKNPALAEAVRLRDRFIAIHGAISGRGPSKRALSNTGIVGVSETVHWVKSRPFQCFLVSAAPNFRKRIYFGPQRPRAVALRMATQLRSAAVSAAYDVKPARPLALRSSAKGALN